MSCWPWLAITNSMAAAAMFANLSDKLSKLVCGFSPPTTAEDRYKAGLRSLLLLPPSPQNQPSKSSSPSPPPSTSIRSPEDDDNADERTSAMSPAEHDREADDMASSTLPCIAFASEHGYKLFSLAEMRILDAGADEVTPLAPVVGRRLIPSPYGGTVLATDVCYNHPCHLINPFTGERTSLPDLPIPLSEKTPVHFHPDNVIIDDDGLAWDWSPHGVMVARGDTAFFFSGSGEWTPVHQSALSSPMTVNYRTGSFFLLELRSLVTTVIDSSTLRVRAEIPPPTGVRRRDVDAAYLAPSSSSSSDEAILLVHRGGDDVHGGMVFTEAYRAKEKKGSMRWWRVHDIGDHAVFVDGAHAFTVDAGEATGARANRVYVLLSNTVARPGGRRAVVYDVGYCDLMRPEMLRRMRIDVGEVEPMWGQPHWIIRRDGSDRVGA